MISFLKRNKTNIFIIFVFLILPFIFFKDAFRLNSVILGLGDPTAYYIPLHQLKMDLLKNLELPFWNRYNFCGFPLLSNPQASIFYPVTLILGLLFSTVTAYNLSLLLLYSLAGIFLYLFLNEYKLNKLASFTAGLVFMFSGLMISNRSHPVFIYTMVWTPLILLFLEKYRKSRRLEFVLVSSIIYSISFFAGHPQIFLYSSLVILLFIIYYTFIYEGGKKYYFLLSGLVFIIGFLIISIQLIPTYELIKNSIRNVTDYNYFSSYSYNPKLLPTLFFPFITGNPFYQFQNVPTYFGPWNYTEMIKYFGITTIPLLVFGFFRKDKHKYFWIFLLVFSFLLVLGNHTPFYRLMYYVPLFNKFRVPSRNWFEFGLAFSVLVGFGFDYFIKLDKQKIKKIIIGIIIFFSSILSGFFVFYLLLKTKLKYNLINFLVASSEHSKYLLQNISLGNYSIFIPLIIISCTILAIILFLFKKNKFLYILLVLLIFIDLFHFGYLHEPNNDINYLNNKIEDSSDLRFLNQKDNFFRIYPIKYGVSGIILFYNKNIHKKLDSVMGYEPLMLKNYRFITGLDWSSGAVADWQSLLLNNIVLSMLNAKYIIVPEPEDIDKFKDKITKSYWKDIEPVLDKTHYSKAEFKRSRLSANKDEIIIGGGEHTAKLYKVPIDIESGRDYIVNFKIKENKKIDNYIHFDFYGDNYDNPGQEFYLGPEDIGEEYVEVDRIINSEDVTYGSDIYFRIFTNSDGEVALKDLGIHEVVRYYNYETVYSDGYTLILENKNFIPRFYFVSEVRGINSLEEVKDILWEEDIFGDYYKFDPKTIALVQGIDFNRRKFNTEDTNVDIIEYKNNKVTLETISEDDSFLIFSDNYYPGWKAYIDNIETKIYRTNGIIKGIYIPKGKHAVIFKYIPSYFWIGAAVSLSTFILVIAGIVILFLRRRK